MKTPKVGDGVVVVKAPSMGAAWPVGTQLEVIVVRSKYVFHVQDEHGLTGSFTRAGWHMVRPETKAERVARLLRKAAV